ncbi:MAG TPA: addiction module toxin RelE [Cytophagales bacterium]|nr:addiction module toxin RelE [Cytophagales bacterium]HAA20099.1 addiction module toxin RelE [Cytophagales bacterium]HAP60043.1 addiction module toxin RelE [Cytophagales bacterium]
MTGYSVFVSPHARLDVIDAVEWYEEQQVGLGSDFAEAYSQIQDRIQSNPHQFPRFGRQYYRALFSRFPYAVYFQIVHEEQLIDILAVKHQHRSPRHILWSLRRNRG